MNISNKHFQKLNQLPINQRFKQNINTAVFKLVQSESPSSVKFSDQLKISITTRNSYLKLGDPFRKTSTGQSSLSYIGPAFWDIIPEILKKTKNCNTFFRVWLFNFFCTYLNLYFYDKIKLSCLLIVGICWQEMKRFTVQISVQIFIKMEGGQERRGIMVQFGIKTDAGLKEG